MATASYGLSGPATQSCPGRGMDPGRKRNSTAAPQGIDAALERLSACKRQHSVDAPRGEIARGGHDISAAAVHDGIGAQSLREGQSVLSIVDSLNGSQPGGCNRARLLENESSRDMADAIGRHRDEFRIEASLGIVPAVRVG